MNDLGEIQQRPIDGAAFLQPHTSGLRLTDALTARQIDQIESRHSHGTAMASGVARARFFGNLARLDHNAKDGVRSRRIRIHLRRTGLPTTLSRHQALEHLLRRADIDLEQAVDVDSALIVL